MAGRGCDCGPGCVLLFIPSFRTRFVESGPGNVEHILPAEDLGTGRFQVWPALWAKAKEKIVLGWGVGSSADFVPLVWTGISQPHNDYLRIIYEQGFVGLGIFLTAAITQMAVLRREIRRCDGEKKLGFLTAYLALAVLLLVSLTENTIVYGLWYMHPLFAVLGGAYGVRHAGRTFAEPPMRAPFALRAHPNQVLPSAKTGFRTEGATFTLAKLQSSHHHADAENSHRKLGRRRPLRSGSARN